MSVVKTSLTGLRHIVAWLVSAALTVLDWMILRTALVVVADQVRRLTPEESPRPSGWRWYWVAPALDQAAVFVLGAVALVLVLAYDPIYRTAAQSGKFGRRFFTITAIQVGIAVICGVIISVARA